MLFLPSVYYLWDAMRLNMLFKNEVHKLWLLDNGDQLVVETMDGLLHKLNIIDNREHELTEAKDKSLLFVMSNSGREFIIAAKNSEKIDYDMIDRIIRAICVDTSRSQEVYHHLISNPMPKNLRPQVFNEYKPRHHESLNSSAFLWRYANRTIYRSSDIEGADKKFLHWLRNVKTDLNDEEKALRDEFGFTRVYDPEMFYKTHKIS